MFEQFPYANFHELNMDWIVKIAKDFLDQYTNIQNTITTGLESLDTKAQDLESLLQAWYDTHSEDIATQLTQALADLASEFDTKLAEFGTAADRKAAQAAASIPEDYSALSTKVTYLIDGLRRWNTVDGLREGMGFVKAADGTLNIAAGSYGYSTFIKVKPGEKYYYRAYGSPGVLIVAAYQNEYDTTAVIADSVPGRNASTGIYTVPDGINYVRMVSNPWSNVILEKIPTRQIVNDTLDAIVKAGNVGKFVEPDSTLPYKMYNHLTNSYTQIGANSQCQTYNNDTSAIAYTVTSSLYAGDAGYPIVSYFDSTDTCIGTEIESIPGSTTVSADKYIFYPPANCTYFKINARKENPEVKIITKDSAKINHEISILFIGNSLLQDGISYVPAILTREFPFIDFKFYMWYIAGATLGDQYTAFTNNTSADIFSIAVNKPNWQNVTSMTMAELLQQKRFDVVCMEEYLNYKTTYTATDLADWNNCQKYILNRYNGKNPLEFITYFHAPLRTRKEEVYALTKTANAMILKNTAADDMLGCGMAIYHALDTALGTLGDGGDMTPGDRTHAQEGIPCLVQAYTVVNWILKRMSQFHRTLHMQFQMTEALYNTLNIPGPNLGTGVITGTAEQNAIAQTVAVQAFKEADQFVIENEY